MGTTSQKAHPGLRGALDITPAPPVASEANPDATNLIISWPPASEQQLVQQGLKESIAAASARLRRGDRLIATLTFVGTIAMFLIGIALGVAGPAWFREAEVIWLTWLGAIFVVAAPGLSALIRPATAIAYRRTVLGALVLAVTLEVFTAGYMTLAFIGIADMGVSGQLSNAFVNLWLLEWGLSYACSVTLIISTILLKNRGPMGALK